MGKEEVRTDHVVEKIVEVPQIVHEEGQAHPTVMESMVMAAPSTVMAPPAVMAPATMMAPPVMAAPVFAAPPVATGSVVMQATPTEPTYAAPQTFAAAPTMVQHVPAHTGGAVYSVPGHSHGIVE